MTTLIEVEHRDYRDTLKRCADLGGARLIVTSPPYLDSRARGQYGFDCPAWTEADYDALGEAVLAGLMPGGVCAPAPGDPVCDPFTGSGTVAISAAKHGRAFVGGDLGERLEDAERGRTRARWADAARERAHAAAAQAGASAAAVAQQVRDGASDDHHAPSSLPASR